MKRTTLFLDEETERELQRISRRQKRPMAVVVREAIAEYVAQAKAAETAKVVGFIGIGRSGRRDTAERHEDLLWKDLPHTSPGSKAPQPAITRRRRS